jgi:transcriptional regulator GlxA family with amidase domain
MRRSQGKYFSQEELNSIKHLLSSTDMTLQEIATRMGCSKSAVVGVNHTFQIRDYHGRRSLWSVEGVPMAA